MIFIGSRSIRRILVLLLPVAFGVCCTREATPVLTPSLETVTLRAESAPKSGLESASMSVVWFPSDELSVLDAAGNHRFVTKGHGTTADFVGLGTPDGERLVLYPYSASATCSSSVITTVFPAVQTGVPGSFPDGANLAAGIVHGDNFKARNIGGIIGFTLGRSDIVSVKLSSLNASDALSGSIRISFDQDELPVAECFSPAPSVTLVPSDVLCSLESGTYFLDVLPCSLEDGYAVELTCQNGYVRRMEYPGRFTLGRSKYVDLGIIDDGMPEDRAVILFGDSITHNNVFQHLNSILQSKNTPSVRYRAVLAGRSGETPSQIAARQGGVPLYVRGPLTIPARASEKISIGSLYTDVSESGERLSGPSRHLFVDLGVETSEKTWTGCTNPFRIGGVLCRISGSDGSLTLSRVFNSETPTTLDGPYVPVEPLASWKYSGAWACTCYMGTNGEGSPTKIPYNHNPGELHSYEDLGRFYDLAIAHSGTRFLVLGFHNQRWNEATRDYLAGKFGNIFVDLRTVGYTQAEKIASEIGVELDSVDYSYIAGHQWPWSWQDASNTIHPSPVGHKAYARIVFDRMEEMGWFE